MKNLLFFKFFSYLFVSVGTFSIFHFLEGLIVQEMLKIECHHVHTVYVKIKTN